MIGSSAKKKTEKNKKELERPTREEAESKNCGFIGQLPRRLRHLKVLEPWTDGSASELGGNFQ